MRNKQQWFQTSNFTLQTSLNGGAFGLRRIDGTSRRSFHVDTGTALTSEQIANLPGIDGLFQIVQDAIDRNVPVLEVSYNTDSGYPETIYIDYYSQVIDDEIYHVVSNFQLLN